MALPLEKFVAQFNRVNRSFYRFENVPASTMRKIMNTSPLADPEDRQNNSPPMRVMINIASNHRGTLEGHVIPVESGRSDARITVEGFTLRTSELKALRLANEFSPDEFDEIKPGFWRFWWD